MQTSKINHFELSREYLNIERYLTLQISLSSTWYKYPIEKFSICVIECQLEYQAFIWNVKHSIIVEVSISFVCFIVSAESVGLFIGSKNILCGKWFVVQDPKRGKISPNFAETLQKNSWLIKLASLRVTRSTFLC